MENDRKRIAFITSGRSDLALLTPLLSALQQCPGIEPWVIATGAHMTKLWGKTIQEIGQVNDRVDILMQSNNQVSTANAIGLGVIKFSELFIKRHLSLLFLLGDRFEMMAAAVAAHCLNLPMVHAFGGECTKASQDDGWRNCMSMLAQYHLTAHDEYTKRLRCMLSDREVWTVGSLSVDAIHNAILMSREELSLRFRLPMKRYAVVTYHPETTCGRDQNITDFQQLLAAVDQKPEMDYIFTFANQDALGVEFNRMILEFKAQHRNVKYVRNAGQDVYLSLVKHAEMVIGNSSSGIMEAPYFGTPTINVGDRQYGRIMAPSIYQTRPMAEQIMRRMEEAHKQPPCGQYGEGAAEHIVEILRRIV